MAWALQHWQPKARALGLEKNESNREEAEEGSSGPRNIACSGGQR